MMICVYGTFNDKDMRIKAYEDCDPRPYIFQNIMRDAGYDAEVFSVPDLEQTEKRAEGHYVAFDQDKGKYLEIAAPSIEEAGRQAAKFFLTRNILVWCIDSRVDMLRVWEDKE